MQSVTFKSTLPSPDAFAALRNSVGWGQITLEQAEAALANSLCGVIADLNGKTIGMARVIGDGVLNIYIQDVIIIEGHRRKGIGQALMTELLMDLKRSYPAGCTVGLMAAKDQDAFYASFGFIPRPSDVYGAGMIAALGDLKAETG